jgi:uncharacterized protein (UPF0147 family)
MNLSKKLNKKSLKQILETYALPPRFLAYFASQCAKDAMSKLKDSGSDPDPRAIAAISMAEDYGNGKDFSPEYMGKVTDDAYYAAAYDAYYAYHADCYKPLFFALIESRLSKLEKILIFG